MTLQGQKHEKQDTVSEVYTFDKQWLFTSKKNRKICPFRHVNCPKMVLQYTMTTWNVRLFVQLKINRPLRLQLAEMLNNMKSSMTDNSVMFLPVPIDLLVSQ